MHRSIFKTFRGNLVAEILAISLLLSSCSNNPASQEGEAATNVDKQEGPSEALFTDAPWNKQRVSSAMSLKDAQQRLINNYRLQPDRRFLLAVGYIHEFFQGQPAPPVKAEFEHGQWSITCGSTPAGKLREFASFAESVDLLKRWCEANLKQKQMNITTRENPGVAAQSVAPSSLFATLRSCDEEWNRKTWSQSTLKQAADALTLVACQNLDLLEVSDEITARALGLNALYSQCFSDSSNENLCLLANRLGYLKDQLSLAARLPQNNDVRAYALGDSAALKKLTDAKDASNRSIYLYQKLLCERSELDRWKVFAGSRAAQPSLILPILNAYAETAARDSLVPTAIYLMTATIQEMGNKQTQRLQVNNLSWNYETYTQTAEWITADLPTQFQQREASIPSSSKGRFFDSTLEKKFYEACFSSGVGLLARAYFVFPQSRNSLDRFIGSLKVSSGGISEQLAYWIKGRFEAYHRLKPIEYLQESLARCTDLGAPALLATLNDVGTYYTNEKPQQMIGLGRQLFQRLDCRPANVMSIALAAEKFLLDFRLARKLYSASSTYIENEVAADRSRQVAGSGSHTFNSIVMDERVLAGSNLRRLRRMERYETASKPEIKMQYEELIKKHRDSWQPTRAYWSFLMRWKHHDEAQAIVRNWITSATNYSDSDRAEAQIARAESLYRAKKYEEARSVLDQLKGFDTSGFLRMRALIANALGKKQEAETWCSEALVRYPQSPDIIILSAEIAWRNGDYKKAAQVLAKGRALLSSHIWHSDIAPVFLSIFQDDQNKAILALGALKDLGLAGAGTTAEIAHRAAIEKRPDIAFQILMESPPRGGEQFEHLIMAYTYKKEWQGEKEALNWIEKIVPPNRRLDLSSYALYTDNHELLWGFVPNGSETELLWVRRAASVLGSSHPEKWKASAVRKYFSPQPGSKLMMLGRYLTDLMTEDAFTSQSMSQEELSVAAFYTGYKKLCKGSEIGEGTSWWRLCVETENASIPEYYWSWEWLGNIETTYINKVANRKINNLRIEPSKNSSYFY